MKNAQILSLLEELPEKRIDSKRFGDIFQMDGMPLWYYLGPLMHSSFLPRPFKPEWEVEQEIKKGKSPSSLEKLKFNLFAFVMKKGLMLNEKIKLLISKPMREGRGAEKRNVLFIVTTDQILREDGKLEFLEFGRVLDCLKRDRKIKPLILTCDPFSKNSFFGLKRYTPLLYGYLTPEILKESERISQDLHRKWKTLDEKSKIKLFTYRGRSYWQFFEDDMNYLFSKELLFTFVKYYLAFKEILKNHDIKVVFLTSFAGFYELAVSGAVYKLNRKIVQSSHGYARGPVGIWKFRMKNVVFAAGGEQYRADMLKGGVKKEGIIVTGFPFLDEIAQYKQRRPSKAKKTVALLTTILVESKYMEKNEYFKLIYATLAQLKNVNEVGKIIIKLHPREKYKSEYESIAKSLGLKNIEVIQEPGKASLYSVLSDSDLLIGFGSTAVLEGLMMGKDAIHLEMFETRPIFEFKKATFCIKKIDGLAEAVRKVLTDARLRKKMKIEREKYLRQAFYKLDGKAYERVAALIAAVVKNRAKFS